MANKRKNLKNNTEETRKDEVVTQGQDQDHEQLNPSLSDILFPKQSFKLRILTVFNYYLLLNVAGLLIYGAITGFAPLNAFLASTFGLVGLICISLALKSHLKYGDSLYPGITAVRAYLEFVLAGVCTLLGAFTFLG